MRSISLPVLLVIIALGAMLSGCGAMKDGGESSTGPAAPASDYYYNEFPDVAIPQGMEAAKERYITFSQSGQKIGTEEFSGRIEAFSLVNAMQQYLSRDGWQMRSSFRSKRTIMIFEKQDRLCTLLIDDGLISSKMTVYVTARLSDGITTQYSAPAAPAVSAAPVAPRDRPLQQ